jgi:hypothetical protein
MDNNNAGTGNLEGTRPTTINDSGQIVGWVLAPGKQGKSER